MPGVSPRPNLYDPFAVPLNAVLIPLMYLGKFVSALSVLSVVQRTARAGVDGRYLRARACRLAILENLACSAFQRPNRTRQATTKIPMAMLFQWATSAPMLSIRCTSTA